MTAQERQPTSTTSLSPADSIAYHRSNCHACGAAEVSPSVPAISCWPSDPFRSITEQTRLGVPLGRRAFFFARHLSPPWLTLSQENREPKRDAAKPTPSDNGSFDVA